MRLFMTLGAGFAIAFGVGWLSSFSYQADWVAGLVLSATFYLSLQVDELYMLVLQSVPNAPDNANLPEWIKKRLEGKN
jgi:hypothetical protein